MPFKNMKTCGQGGTGEEPRPEPQRDCFHCSAHNLHEIPAFPSLCRQGPRHWLSGDRISILQMRKLRRSKGKHSLKVEEQWVEE